MIEKAPDPTEPIGDQAKALGSTSAAGALGAQTAPTPAALNPFTLLREEIKDLHGRVDGLRDRVTELEKQKGSGDTAALRQELDDAGFLHPHPAAAAADPGTATPEAA